MDFTQSELDAIESACRAQASAYRDLAGKADRPIQRNQRLDASEALRLIAEKMRPIDAPARTFIGVAPTARTESLLTRFVFLEDCA